jgi:hypothetical protein
MVFEGLGIRQDKFSVFSKQQRVSSF